MPLSRTYSAPVSQVAEISGGGNNDEPYLLVGPIASEHSVGGNDTAYKGSIIHNFLLLGKERKGD